MEATKVYPKRKGLRSGARTEFTVIGTVKPGHEQALRETIKRRGADPRRIEDAKKFGTIHEARVVLIDNDTRLLIATSFDGDWDVYIDDFARTRVLQDWAEFLVHCQGYPDAAGVASLSLDQQKEFLTASQVTAALFEITCEPSAWEYIAKTVSVPGKEPVYVTVAFPLASVLASRPPPLAPPMRNSTGTPERGLTLVSFAVSVCVWSLVRTR